MRESNAGFDRYSNDMNYMIDVDYPTEPIVGEQAKQLMQELNQPVDQNELKKLRDFMLNDSVEKRD